MKTFKGLLEFASIILVMGVLSAFLLFVVANYDQASKGINDFSKISVDRGFGF